MEVCSRCQTDAYSPSASTDVDQSALVLAQDTETTPQRALITGHALGMTPSLGVSLFLAGSRSLPCQGRSLSGRGSVTPSPDPAPWPRLYRCRSDSAAPTSPQPASNPPGPAPAQRPRPIPARPDHCTASHWWWSSASGAGSAPCPRARSEGWAVPGRAAGAVPARSGRYCMAALRAPSGTRGPKRFGHRAPGPAK